MSEFLHNNSLERTGDAAAKARDNGDMGSQKVVLGPRSLAAHLCLRPKHRQLAAIKQRERKSSEFGGD